MGRHLVAPIMKVAVLCALTCLMGCVRRPEIVLSNMMVHLDNPDDRVSVELDSYFATWVGVLGDKLEWTSVTDLHVECADPSICRAEVRPGGEVVQVVGFAASPTSLVVRYLSPGA